VCATTGPRPPDSRPLLALLAAGRYPLHPPARRERFVPALRSSVLLRKWLYGSYLSAQTTERKPMAKARCAQPLRNGQPCPGWATGTGLCYGHSLQKAALETENAARAERGEEPMTSGERDTFLRELKVKVKAERRRKAAAAAN
jgi:hypothetical protein